MTAFTNFPVTAMADDVLAGSFSASAAGTLFSVDTTGFLMIVAQVTNAGTTCTWTSECSNDGTTWVTAPMQAGIAGTSVTTGTTAGLYLIPVVARFHRLRLSTYTSGTVAGVAYLRNTFTLNLPNTSAQDPGYSRLSNAAGTISSSATRILSAASTNATLVTGSAGHYIYAFCLANTSASWRFFKVYNKATAPTVGTDTPILTIAIPPGGSVAWECPFPIASSTGIGYAITGAYADADTTAIGAGEVIGFLNWS